MQLSIIYEQQLEAERKRITALRIENKLPHLSAIDLDVAASELLLARSPEKMTYSQK